MPADTGTPDLVRHCVAAVAKQYGGDTSKAFAICVASLQKAGYLKPGTMELTAAGKKKEKEHEAEPDAKKKLAAYEKLLKASRKEEASDVTEESAFKVGQRVKAQATAQGLQKGETYEVTDMEKTVTPFGTYVSYQLQGAMGKAFRVTNGHLLLSPLKSEAVGELPRGFKSKPVTVTISKIGRDNLSSGLEFHISGKVYDEYMRDQLGAIVLEPEKAIDALSQAGMTETEIEQLMADIRSVKGPLELDKPIKLKTTVLVRESRMDDFDRLTNPTRTTGLEDLPRPIARKHESVSRGESSMDAMRRLAGISGRYEDRAAPKPVAEGMEMKVTKALEKAGFSPQWDFHFEGGLLAFGPKEAEAIVKALNATGDFAPAKVGRKDGNFVRIEFGKAESISEAVSASDFWSFVDEADWGGSGDYEAIAEKMFAKHGAAKMAEYEKVFNAHLKKLGNAVEKWEEESGKKLPVGDDGYDDLRAHIIGLGKAEFDLAMKSPEKVYSRAKNRSYEESFAYVFQKPSGYSESRRVTESEDVLRHLLGERTKFLHDKGDTDPEGAMVKAQLQRIVTMAQMMDEMLVEDDQLPGWVQSHISDAANNLSQVFGYMEPKNRK